MNCFAGWRSAECASHTMRSCTMGNARHKRIDVRRTFSRRLPSEAIHCVASADRIPSEAIHCVAFNRVLSCVTIHCAASARNAFTLSPVVRTAAGYPAKKFISSHPPTGYPAKQFIASSTLRGLNSYCACLGQRGRRRLRQLEGTLWHTGGVRSFWSNTPIPI